jgi:hypothetical protein
VTRRSQAFAAWLLVAGLLGTAAIWARSQRGPTGAILTLETASASPGDQGPRRVPAIDLREVRALVPDVPVAARWHAYWNAHSTGSYRVVAETDGAFTLRVDGITALATRGGRARADLVLQPGVHLLEATYESVHNVRWLRLRWSPPEGERRAFDGASIFTAPPTSRHLAWVRGARALAVASVATLLLPPLLAAGWLASTSRASPAMMRALRFSLPLAVVLVGGALRFEALIARYAWEGPAWALNTERVLVELHPDTLLWEPAEEHRGGDPYHYFRRAREMRSFYEPHVREPLFPFATRVLLPLVGDRPLAVNVASAVFSTLGVLATYLLGTVAFSRWVGLGAALCLALDRDAVWWGVEGFRDDAFMVFVVLSAAALLRLRRQPSVLFAILAGLAGSAACLTRITALAFLVPAWIWIAVARGPDARERRRLTGLGVLLNLTLVAPFLLSCALAFGDAFHSVNAHTKFYRSRAGLEYEQPLSWSGYLASAFAPRELVQTGLRGLTTEPFASKWRGLDYLTPWLRRLLAPLAVAGLLLFALSREGRLLLVILLGCLLPYAFTWKVPGGAEWRFTLAAYPFYLLAAFLTLQRVFGWMRASPAGNGKAGNG